MTQNLAHKKSVEQDRTKIRDAALRIIREILERPDYWSRQRASRGLVAPPPLSIFRRLEPLGWGLADDDDWWFAPEDCPPDLVWPLDVSVIFDWTDGEEGVTLHRYRSATRQEIRGQARRFSPYMMRQDVAQVHNAELFRFTTVLAWLGGNWVDAQEFSPPSYIIENARVQAIATSFALRQRYEWAVSLSLENSPSIRFATDPIGVKEVFRIRDLPEGRDRREALMTWVQDHWRQKRADPELEVYVRKHLRGTTEFTWSGMNCELTPAQFDLDQRDRIMAEREAMRVAGTDKRRREKAAP